MCPLLFCQRWTCSLMTRLCGVEESGDDEVGDAAGAEVSHDPQLPQPSPQLACVLNNLAILF